MNMETAQNNQKMSFSSKPGGDYGKDQKTYDYDVQKNVGVPMRDGTMLRADVYRPKVEHDVPVVLVRTQYDKNGEKDKAEFFAKHGYIAVAQDVRGQYASEGEFYEFANEQRDGYDSVEWAAKKIPGSNGKVGMWGTSYVGATQWMAAEMAPPHLETIIPRFTAASYYQGWTYHNGAFSQAFTQAWAANSIVQSAAEHRGNLELADQIKQAADPENLENLYWQLPLNQYEPFHPDSEKVAPYYSDWVKHSTNDLYWKEWAPLQHHEDIEVPVLGIAGWYDVFLQGELENFKGMQQNGGTAKARKNQHVVLGPWIHSNSSQRIPWESDEAPENRVPWSASKSVDYGSDADISEDNLQLKWFDYWLKGEMNNGISSMPKVQYFLMGANKWKSADQWPLPNTEWKNFYLNSGGHANSKSGDGELISKPADNGADEDHYQYDPRNPVESHGGRSCCQPERAPMGPADQHEAEIRNDVLVFDTEELDKDIEVTGPIEVTLYASSTAKDTDFTAKLVDVHPNGEAIQLNDGIQRARFRESLSKPELIQPGKVYKYTINVWPTSNLFKKGHKIRLDISSSNFPMYDRNPNTGHEFGTDSNADLVVADQTIYHSEYYPSNLRLPIIPDQG